MLQMSGGDVLHAAAERKLTARDSFALLTASPYGPDLAPIRIPRGLLVPIVGKPFAIDVLLDTVADAVRRLHVDAETMETMG